MAFTCRKLFEPIKIGSLELKNRVVMGPMGTSLADEGNKLSDRQIAYYERRAAGGAGLIIIEHTYPQKLGCKSGRSLGMWDKSETAKWRLLVDALHRHGAKAAVEIGHLGRCTDYSRMLGETAVASSPIRCRMIREPVREATEEDIRNYFRDYLNSVRIALDAGFDAIELHFTNGYFLAGWLSGRTNRRTDKYGGNLENRLRLPLELISMVREEVGGTYPLLARLAAREVNGGREIEESRVIAAALEDAGIDALEINAGSPDEFDWEFPSYHKPQGFMLEDAEKIKRSVGIPVIGGGRIVEPRMAERAIVENRIDLVAINRGLIADPDWPNKASAGMFDGIRRCIACTRCIHEKEGDGIICSVNPYAGKESKWLISKSHASKKVLVVGGGPAGLQAAIAAAERGHDVTLAERSPYLGGMIRPASMPPHKWEIGGIVVTLAAIAARLGVEILVNRDATAEWIENENFDEVILACGASPLYPKVTLDENFACDAVDVLSGNSWPGERVVIVGGGMIGCETAEYLTGYGKKITIIEMLDEVARDMPWNLREIMLENLEKHDVRIIRSAKILSALSREVTYELENRVEVIKEVDNVIIAVGMKADTRLQDALAIKGIKTVVIGDAKKPSRLREALYDALETAIYL